MRKSLVSLTALGLFLGAPALADTGMAQTTTPETTTTQQQTTTPDTGQMEELLAGYEERSEIKGHLARAMTAEGDPVLVLVGPQNLDADGSAAAADSDIQSRFQGGGFTGLEILDEARIVRAEFDEEHYIFALSADQITGTGMQTGGVTGAPGATGESAAATDTQTGTQTGTTMGQTDTETEIEPDTQAGTETGQTDTQAGAQTDTQTGTTMSQTETQTGQTGTETDTQAGTTTMGQTDTTGSGTAGQVSRALSEPDAERIVSDLEEAGLEEAKEFKGRLVRAMTEDGEPVFFIITSKDMESDAEVDISEEEVRSKLETANLEDIEFIDEAKIVRGSLEDDHVFVLAGDLMGQAGQQ